MNVAVDKRLVVSALALVVGSTMTHGLTQCTGNTNKLLSSTMPTSSWSLNVPSAPATISAPGGLDISASGTSLPYRLLTEQERSSISQLAGLPANWDGFGSLQPSIGAIQNALILIDDLFDVAIATKFAWVQPHISASEEGDVVFEWWSAGHKLTV